MSNYLTLLRRNLYTKYKELSDNTTLNLDEAVSIRNALNFGTTQYISTSQIDVLFNMSIAEQLDFLASGYLNTQFGTGTTSNFFQYLPYGYWTTAHTTAASAITNETGGGLTAKVKRMSLIGQLLNYPQILIGGDTFMNVWDALTVGLSDGEKIDVLSQRLITSGSTALSNTTVGHIRLSESIKTVLTTLAQSTTATLNDREALLALMSVAYNDPIYHTVLTDNDFLANLIAFNATAKQAFFNSLVKGKSATTIVPLIMQCIKANPTAFSNLLSKGTTITRLATLTTAEITGITGSNFVLLASSCDTTTTGITLNVRGLANNTSSFSRDKASISFRYKPASLPALTNSVIDIGSALPFIPFNTPEFAQAGLTADTLSMTWLNCD